MTKTEKACELIHLWMQGGCVMDVNAAAANAGVTSELEFVRKDILGLLLNPVYQEEVDYMHQEHLAGIAYEQGLANHSLKLPPINAWLKELTGRYFGG